MASYEDWSERLRTYFLSGITRGSSVYLSVDEDSLLAAGHTLSVLPLAPEQIVNDFLRAVRSRVGGAGDRVVLSSIVGQDSTGVPRCLPFLCAMVLAASWMADEGEISELNYFRRLREVLGLPQETGRPPGLETGIEEPFWKAWNLWLQEQGFLPSARHGEAARKYINYALSQAMLRGADKDRLRRLFQAKGWTADWDADTLFGRVRHEASSLTQHLQELLSAGSQRLRAVTEAVFQEYELWREAPEYVGVHEGRRRLAGNTVVIGGLYRTENPITGQVRYYLYPRQRRGQQFEGRWVQFAGGVHQLLHDRPGWLLPIGPLGVSALDESLRLPIEPPGDPHTIALPQRLFWVLVPDPDNPESGVLASWTTPSLGMPFLILTRPNLLPDLERLREERLIEWNGDPSPSVAAADWIEVRDCMIVSEAWQGVFPENRDLYEALRPTQSLSIGLSDGLRVPGLSGWLEGHGPVLTVFGFHQEAEVRVIDVADERIVFDAPCAVSSPLLVPWPGVGDYRIEAASGAETELRLAKILAWDELRMVVPSQPEGVILGGVRVSGATIKAVETKD